MKTLENLESEAKAAKVEFNKYFDGNGNFLATTDRNGADFLAASDIYNAADKVWREAVSQANQGCSVAAQEIKESNLRQLAAIQRLLERESRTSGIRKSQSQMDAEYDAQLARNND